MGSQVFLREARVYSEVAVRPDQGRTSLNAPAQASGARLMHRGQPALGDLSTSHFNESLMALREVGQPWEMSVFLTLSC